jgi:methionine-rich copper-binding protein CopC
MMLTFIRSTAFLAALGVLSPAAASMHATLTRAEPPVDGRTTTPPTRLRLWFSESPELPFTTLTLADSAGKVVKLGGIEHGDTQLEIRAKIAATLYAGRYTVKWRTAGPDGHATTGTFAFTIVPPQHMR